jgi:hypothetical protein
VLVIDQSQLSPLQREHFLPPYERHAWEGRGPGLFSIPVCTKCRRWQTSPDGAGFRCTVILPGPPFRYFDCLHYPGGLTVREDPTP